MKVYFTGSQKLLNEKKEVVSKILSILREKTSNEPYTLSDGNRNKLSVADLIIVEDTFESTDAGYDIANAVNLKKQILVLREKGSNNSKSELLSKSNSRKNIKVVEYTIDTLQAEIEGFIQEVEKKIDTKFILIISPEIDRYLEWVSKNRRMHKAQAVRRAVEALMLDDSNYNSKEETK